MTTVVNGNRKDIKNIKHDLYSVNRNLTRLSNLVEIKVRHINSSLNILERRVRAMKIITTVTS